MKGQPINNQMDVAEQNPNSAAWAMEARIAASKLTEAEQDAAEAELTEGSTWKDVTAACFRQIDSRK